MGGHLVVMLGAYTGAMLQCIRCRNRFTGFGQVEPNIDSFGMHFTCPSCGRRNELRVVGYDRGTPLIEQCEPQALTGGGDRIPRRR
ncbi:hypothetical protein A9K76_07905 [Stenotrophomonas maltophilia]|nr:hypothetical protein A9K76_07905 [Stenotrophomonas maltophilia]